MMNSFSGGNIQGQLIANGEQLSLGLGDGNTVNFDRYYIENYSFNVHQDLVNQYTYGSSWREVQAGNQYVELRLNIVSSGLVTIQKEGFSLITPAIFNSMTVRDLFKLINKKIDKRK